MNSPSAKPINPPPEGLATPMQNTPGNPSGVPEGRPALSPLWVRLIAFAALTLLAFAAIRVIDGHAQTRSAPPREEPAP
jgi:hypothetical protein